jgi:hypothetical protein
MPKLERHVRILQIYTGALTIALIVVLISGFQNTRQRIKELDVERLNIVEANGSLRMTISNKERVPDPIVNGRTFVGARKGAKSAGIIFFNDKGDECGGLAFSGGGEGNDINAGAALLFDQFNQDQTVGIMYNQAGAKRSAGLHVWDRPDIPVSTLIDKMDAIKAMKDGPEKQAELDKMGELGARRVFVGKNQDGAAGMTIADRRGKTRIKLTVDDSNTARLQFLDEAGKVVYTLPQE